MALAGLDDDDRQIGRAVGLLIGRQWRGLGEAFQRLGRSAGRDPIACIAFRRQSRQLDDPHTGYNAHELGGHIARVTAAGRVIVGQNDDATASQVARDLLSPFAGAAVIARREQPECAEGVGVLFALDDEDRRRRIGQDVR